MAYFFKLQNNNLMPEYQTFSLTTILNTHKLRPEVYHHMIHQIKSPLQQQSFQLTNDNSISVQRIPKRPNIPPAPPKSPFNQLENHQFSRTYQTMSVDLQNSRKVQNLTVRDNVNQSFVSPLEYQVNVKQQQSYFNFCGAALDSILKVEDQTQLLLPCRSKGFKRKPIFQRVQSRKPLKSLQEALFALKKINQPQLMFFLEMMGALEKELTKLSKDKIQMESQLSLIYQRLSQQTQYLPQTFEANQAHTRVLRRLKARNSGEVMNKFFKKSRITNQKVGQNHLQRLFLGLSQVQLAINNFITQQDSLQKLSVAFEFIQQNFQYQATFKEQLLKLYDYLSIQLSTDGLELIWDKCGHKILTKDEFIQGLSLNDFVVRQKQGFQSQLLFRGFIRNQI